MDTRLFFDALKRNKMKCWKSFQWPPTCNRNFLIIFLYVVLSDLLQVVNTQSMFSWTPIVGVDKKLINGRSETNINTPKRNFYVHDERQYIGKIAPIPSVGSMPYKVKNDPFRFIVDTKEVMKTKNYLKLDNKPNYSWSSRLKSKSQKYRTMSENNKLVSHLNSNDRNMKPSLENTFLYSNFDHSNNEIQKKIHKNSFSPVQAKISSRSDRQNYLTWTQIEQPAQPQISLSFNPFMTEENKSKRIKKNVKLKKENKDKIPVLPKIKIEPTKVTSSNVFVKEEKSQTHVSNPSRFPVMVMINSEILNDVKDKKNEDVEIAGDRSVKK